jgi:Uncharacterized protein conserved in bacteria (DUF2147)
METTMKTLYLAAALLMASTAAHAGSGISFVIDGQRIHIDAPKNCASLDCLKITGVNTSKFNAKGFGSKKDDDGDIAAAPAAPAPAPVAAAPVAPAPAPVATTAPVAPAAPLAPAPQPEQLAATTPAPLPPAPVAAAPAPAPVAAPVQLANSPLGVWATEENKGNVRVEQCGANLCGYAVNSGERILINMKSEGSKWTGRIHDPDSGKDYDSTIAMKGPNILKVQGCAFGGMFCGGQTWKRIS